MLLLEAAPIEFSACQERCLRPGESTKRRGRSAKWNPRKSKQGRKFIPDEYVLYPRLPALSPLEEAILLRQAQQGDIPARNELWLHYLRLVFSVVNRFYIPRDLLADAIQEGTLGIHRAIALFDQERHTAFSTYAWPWIWQKIQRFLHCRAYPSRIPAHLSRPYCSFRRELRWATTVAESFAVLARWRDAEPGHFRALLGIHRISTAVGLHLLPTDSLPYAEETRAADEMDSETWHARLEASMQNALPTRAQYILCRRFGLDGQPVATLCELGEKLHITRERVRQIEAEAITRLTQHLT